MELHETESLRRTQILSNENLLPCLKRNHGDIAQLSGKLRSYICEPRTYEPFRQLNHLSDSAKQLCYRNTLIVDTLNTDSSDIARCSRMLRIHLKNFDTFREETLEYLDSVKWASSEKWEKMFISPENG